KPRVVLDFRMAEPQTSPKHEEFSWNGFVVSWPANSEKGGRKQVLGKNAWWNATHDYWRPARYRSLSNCSFRNALTASAGYVVWTRSHLGALQAQRSCAGCEQCGIHSSRDPRSAQSEQCRPHPPLQAGTAAPMVVRYILRRSGRS